MFAFDALTDQQINDLQNQDLLADGSYPFTIKEISSRMSKSGNPMLEVKLNVVDKSGIRVLTDYLVASPKMMFKLKHFCESIGFDKEYSLGKLDPAKCAGRSGLAVIGVQKGEPKADGSGFYRDKNNVKDYAKNAQQNGHVDLNDDINF